MPQGLRKEAIPWHPGFYGAAELELTTKDKNGKESVYQLQMSLTEITKNANNCKKFNF